jgi:hypothetical protein
MESRCRYFHESIIITSKCFLSSVDLLTDWYALSHTTAGPSFGGETFLNTESKLLQDATIECSLLIERNQPFWTSPVALALILPTMSAAQPSDNEFPVSVYESSPTCMEIY